MTQTTLNFKLQSTNEKLTPRTGVAILGDDIREIRVDKALRTLLKIENEELILDIDATFIEAHKNTAKWSYKDAPANKNLEFIKQCVIQLKTL